MLTKILFLILLITLIALTTSCSGLLYYPSDQMFYDPTKAGIKPDDIWFKNNDQTNLHGWYFHAKDQKPKGLIVFFHGNAENMTSHFATLLWILSEGYDYFIFDYEGYGTSEGKPSPRNTLEDGKAALTWAYTHHKDLPLIVFGQSLGGAVALRSVIDMRNEFPMKLIVVDSTFASYQGAGRKVLSKNWFTWPFQPLAYLLLSDEYAPGKDVIKFSPLPLVVIHGTKDGTIDFDLGKKIMEYAGEPKELWTVEGGTHTDALWRHPEIRKKFLKKLDTVTAKN